MYVQVFKIRWLMQICVLISLILVNLQMFQYTIVSNTIQSFYGTSANFIYWSTLIFMLCYFVFTFPVSYLLENGIIDLRVAMIACNTLIVCGCALKCFSVAQANFTVAFGGQLLVALANVIVQNIPPQLAVEWFPAPEKTLIINLSIFGQQMGVLLGFAFTSWLMSNTSFTLFEVALDMRKLNYFYTGIALFQWVLVVFVFRAHPANPPVQLSPKSQAPSMKQFLLETMKNLVKPRNFSLLIIAFGLEMGVITTIFTLINFLVTSYVPESSDESGLLGVTIIIACSFTSLLMIVILRHQRHLKFMAIVATIFTTISVSIFLIGLKLRINSLLYVGAVSMGVSVIAFQTTGMEFAFETTFPEPIVSVNGIMNVSSQAFTIVLTTIVSVVYTRFGQLIGGIVFGGTLCFCILLLSFAKCELKRSAAYQETIEALESPGSSRNPDEKTPLLQQLK